MSSDKIVNRVKLRQVLVERFDEDELRTLCFDLGVEYADLPVAGRANKARELVAYLEKRGRIHESVEIGKRMRPDIAWDDAFEPLKETALTPDVVTMKHSLLVRLHSLKERASRRSVSIALAGGAALAVAVGGIYLNCSESEQPVPDGSVNVKIASFADCADTTRVQFDIVAPESCKVEFSDSDEIESEDMARAFVETERGLVIWGQCIEGGAQLRINLELSPEYGPDEVVRLEKITTVQDLPLDQDYVDRLGSAVVDYLCDDYDEAANRLEYLGRETSVLSERAELAFLQGNSLLFSERYEQAMLAYDSASEYPALEAQAYVNRGVAGVNLALCIQGYCELSGQDYPTQGYDTVFQTAFDDLTKAIEISQDTSIKVLAYFSRGMGQVLVERGRDEKALEDCQKITDYLDPEQPLGYVCQAAAYLATLVEDFVCDEAAFKSAREALGQALELGSDDLADNPDLADIFFWRSSLADLQARECDKSEQDKEKHLQDAAADYQLFSNAMTKKQVLLGTDRYMLELIPSQPVP